MPKRSWPRSKLSAPDRPSQMTAPAPENTAGGTLIAHGLAVLHEADPWAKARRTADVARLWRSRKLSVGIERGEDRPVPPEHPARPARPRLMAPRAMARRRAGSGTRGRIALIHALSHIELNAIDLAWDLIVRFAESSLPRAFFDDWVTVAADEARHFLMLSGRLGELGSGYGDLPAHDGLWQAASETRHDLLARLAVVPLVLEARGLDVTPAMADRLARAGDSLTSGIIREIMNDEIAHVGAGRHWFEHLCRSRGQDPIATYQALVRRHFRGRIKPPFNTAARDRAGFGAEYYRSLVPTAANSQTVEDHAGGARNG